MSTSLLYHTQGIRGFQFLNFKYEANKVIAEIIKSDNKHNKCSCCHSRNVRATTVGYRYIRGLPMGSKLFDIKARLHRIRCKECGLFLMEKLDFLPEQKVHYTKRLDRNKIKLEGISLDFGRAYIKWAEEAQPQAELIFDHFHHIKLMNDKLDKIRRTTMNKLEEEEKKQLKSKRWLFIKNIENLEDDTKEELETLRSIYSDLGAASMLKESLRNIYSIADYDYEAKIAFEHWCKLADKTGISYLKTMAKTIRKYIKGIISYWNTGITNAFMEGFNNKIRWLNKQDYGYRDIEYLKLKIFDLPNARTVKI